MGGVSCIVPWNHRDLPFFEMLSRHSRSVEKIQRVSAETKNILWNFTVHLMYHINNTLVSPINETVVCFGTSSDKTEILLLRHHFFHWQVRQKKLKNQQLWSLVLFHFKSFRAQKLCLKIKDLEINIVWIFQVTSDGEMIQTKVVVFKEI